MTQSKTENPHPSTGEQDNPWTVKLFLLTLPHVVGTVGYIAIMALGPVLREELDISLTQFGLFYSAFFAAQLVFALPSGFLTDRLGVGWTLALSMALMGVGALEFVAAADFHGGLFGLFIMGLGYTFVNPATAKGVLEWFPRNRRGTALGIKQLGVPVGGAIGGVAAGFVALYGWQAVVWSAAGASFLSALAMLILVPQSRRAKGRFNLIRDLKRVFGNRNLAIIGSAIITFNFGQASLQTYLAIFLREAAMASQPLAGTCVAIANTASAVGRVGYSYLSDTLFGGQRKAITVAVLVASIAAMVMATQVGPNWQPWALGGLALIMGGTIAAYAALIIAITAESVEPDLTGAAIGYNSIAWSTGGVIGPPLFGYILDATGSYAWAWALIAGCFTVGTLIFAFGVRENPKS